MVSFIDDHRCVTNTRRVSVIQSGSLISVQTDHMTWFNNKRLLEPIGDIPPIELEQAYYEQLERQA